MSPTGDPMVGRTIAQYEVLARVGGGGMGVVYRARDTRLGRIVALKFLPQQWSHDETARLRFVREAQAASATNHPNICTVHDIQTAEDGQLFIVMAYYEGQTLKQRLEGGALPVEEALDIATQIADGLAKAHAQGIIHRDMKPGNVMLTEEGTRIVDFGLATFADALKLTIEHSTLGTAAYMSPEQVRGEAADARSDVWAVGVILYEMLAGHVPFQGSHAEAIAYAIRNESPRPLRRERPDVPEEVEQLVFRAMHKETSVRYADGRELARALRRVRGQSLPLELRTEIVTSPAPSPPRPVRRLRARLLAAAAAVVVGIGAGGWWWATRFIERTSIAVAPFVNESGFSELGAYRLALTYALHRELNDSSAFKPFPYSRSLEALERFMLRDEDVASREAIEALARYSRAQVVVVPTLVHERGEWRARADFRDAVTGVSLGVFETPTITSAQARKTAHDLVIPLADGVRRRFEDQRWRLGFWRSPPSLPLPSIEAGQALEQGVREIGRLEFAAARRQFERAAELDSRSAVALAWLSRSAQLLKQQPLAVDAAERALRLPLERLGASEAVFVKATVAEARGEIESALREYRQAEQAHPDAEHWTLERASLLERHGRMNDAVEAYHAVLARRPDDLRAHAELCRLYSPARLNDPSRAKEQGLSALAGYRAIDNPFGQAQALFCLVDTLRVGQPGERAEARQYAEEAVRVLTTAPANYNMARAQYYRALVDYSDERLADAAKGWETALATARKAGNVVLEPLILMNLGVTNLRLGDRRAAADFYQQSYEAYEAIDDEVRAAQIRANRGALVIEYGDPAEGLRDVQNALAVSLKQNDKNFEVFCRQLLAVYERYAGRQERARSELHRALAIARQQNLDEDIAQLTIDLARSDIEANDYASARERLVPLAAGAAGQRQAEARLHLARVFVRLGAFDAARDALLAVTAPGMSMAPELTPLFHLISGELAEESGDHRGARSALSRSAALWADALPDAASVEAIAYLGLLAARDGDSQRGASLVEKSLSQASTMRRYGLVARTKLFLAEIHVRNSRHGAALARLAEIPEDGEQSIGPELRMQVYYWRAQAHLGLGDRVQADASLQAARRALDRLLQELPHDARSAFTSRETVKPVAMS